MATPTTVDDLVGLIRKSNLVAPAKLDAYLTTHNVDGVSPTDLAHKLTAAGLLTGFQSENLLRGKHRGYFLGKYKLLERIGMGGMGQVFLAEHMSMRRRVAVKVLPPEMAENEFARERFFREARAAGSLDHPNLVRAFDVDSDAEVIFLVMEFIDGINLHDLVARFGPLDPHRAAHYLFQAARGLQYVHETELIHRDIKPANLLVDRSGTIKILDLGLVRSQFDDNELTRGQGVKVLGTADYLAPEQAIDCSKVDIRADIYSLGATGYYLLTGQPPYPGDKIATKLIAHQMKPIPKASTVRPEIPEGLSEVLVKMMAKKPGDRYQTPLELMRALESWGAAPYPPPSELEIPATAGAIDNPSTAVNLGTNMHTPRPDANRDASCSGSAIRYVPKEGISSGIRPGLKQNDFLTPAPRPSPVAIPTQASAARAASAPPVLSTLCAKAVPEAKPAEPVPLVEVVNPFKPVATRVSQVDEAAKLRRRVWIGVAFSLVLGIAVWSAASQSGSAEPPPGANAKVETPAKR